MNNRSIKCTNQDGVSLTFAEKGFTPFLLADCEGVYLVENTVTISQNTMSDGGAYQGSVAKIRNIVLTLKDNQSHVANRKLLHALFKSGESGNLVFTEEPNVRQIEYFVESVNSTGEDGARTYTVSLLCPDPFFYAMHDITVELAAWESAFEFLHTFIGEGEEFGYKSSVELQQIKNDNAANNIGMTIKMSAIDTVTNPTVTKVETQEHITIGTPSKPMSLTRGDVLTIETADNNKHVYLTHNGVTTNVNQYLTEDSTFIQLMRGVNSIGYSADSGAENLIIEISYRLKYVSA